MKKGRGAADFLRTYGWAVLIVVFIVGALAYFGAILSRKEFNPELHDCVEWKCSNKKFGFKLDIASYGNYECSYIVPEPFRLRGSFSGWYNELTFNGTCVSRQPKKSSMQCWRDKEGALYTDSNVNSCSSMNGFICAWKATSVSCSPGGGCSGQEKPINVTKSVCVEVVPR